MQSRPTEGRLCGTVRGRMVGLMACCAMLNYLLRVSLGILLLPIAAAHDEHR